MQKLHGLVKYGKIKKIQIEELSIVNKMSQEYKKWNECI